MSRAVRAVSRVVSRAANAILRPVQKIFGALVKQPSLPGASASNTEIKQIVRSSKEPARYAFGRVGTGALLSWAQEEPGDQTENERLHLVYTLTEGEIDELEEIWLDQVPIAEAGDRASYELIVNSSTPNQYLLENSPDWQESQIGRGLSGVRLTLRYDPDYFASGIPDVLFQYRGRNDVYDPRDGSTGYSDNAALAILWYVRHRLRVPDDEILWDTFIDSANVCDEIVTNPDGSTERRYTVGAMFKADERKDRVLADFEAACAGNLLRVGGRFGLQVGAYYGPYDLTIDEDMVIGPVTGQTEVSRADAVNTMRGTFFDPSQRWSETDYPAVVVQEWVNDDGGPIEDTLNLRFVTSPYQSQRLANIALRRKRAGGRLQVPLNLRGYACRPGRVVRLNLPRLNIDGEFRVVDWDFHGNSGCKVTLQQEQAEIYDDAVGQPFDPLGFISLPTGGIGAPTGLTYSEHVVGEVLQGRLSWNGVASALHYNVVIRRDGVAVQSAQVPGGVTRCEIGGLEAGEYVAEVRARGQLGQSGPATVTFAIHVPATPERVLVQRGNRELTLIPQLPPGESLGGGHYRYYVTQSEGATQPQADYLGDGLTITHTGLAPATTYYYFVQSVNAYGVSPFLRVSVETTNNFQEEIEAIEADLRKPGGIVDQFENDINNLGEAIAGVSEGVTEAQQNAFSALNRAQEAIDNGEFLAIEQDIRHSILQAKTSLASSIMDVEHIVRVGKEQAMAQQINTLEVSFGGSIAQLTQQLTVLASTTQSVSDLLTQLRTDYDDSTTEFLSRITALSDETQALAQTVERLQSSLTGIEASITETQQTIALNEIAQAIRHATLQTQNALGNAVVDVEHRVRSDAEQSLAQRITTLNTDYQGNRASVSSNLIALSSSQAALAGRLEEYEIEVGQEFASVRQEVSAVYDPNTGAVAQAVTTVNVGGVRGVIGIQVQGQQAQIIGIANQFAILNPVNNQLVTAFVVADGRVIIPEAFIDALTITKLRSSTGSLVFQDDRLQAAFIAVEDLIVRQAQSNNFQAGSSGFRFQQNGNAEMNQGIFRATLQGANGTFSGTLTANAINAVRSVNIAGRSATTLVGNYRQFRINFGGNGAGTWEVIREINYDSLGGNVLLVASAGLIATLSGNDRGWMRICRNGDPVVEVRVGVVISSNLDNPPSRQESLSIIDSPAQGGHLYTLEARIDGASGLVSQKRAQDISLSILESTR